MTILSGDATKYYTPKQQLGWAWTRNTQMNVSGGGGAVSTDSSGVSGYIDPITTSHDIISLQVDIRYDGPVNIGERLIKTAKFPNYWRDPRIIAKAKQNLTGCENFLADETSTCFGMLELASWLVLGCCFLRCKHTAAKNKLQAEIQRVADDQLAKDLAGLLEAADKLVEQRIAAMQPQQQPASTGTQDQGGVKISNEHLQILLTTLAQQQQQLQQQSGNNGSLLTNQYNAQQVEGLVTTLPSAPPQSQSMSARV